MLFFNDGYHVEHHLRPGAHWTEIGRATPSGARQSRWPPVLRWMDRSTLDALERLVLRSGALQRFVLDRHARAFRGLLTPADAVKRVTIVGGGLFPRTALVIGRLWPAAAITVIDSNADHLALARSFLDARVTLVHAAFEPSAPTDADLVVVPLAYRGDRRRLYACPPARLVAVHDWIWARKSPGVLVSWLLCKRLNLVRR